MEMAMSAIAGDLVSRFMSFLMKKYRNHVGLEEKVDRLKQLLLRVHTIVEEAEGRYIINSGMLIQLRMLVEAMYRGYYVLDTVKYRSLEEAGVEEEVSSSSTLHFIAPIKRLRVAANTTRDTRGTASVHELQSALDNLETLVANMTEFVILLDGCERMSQGPYDSYLYIDNFMFGRQVEKQQIINILLYSNPPPGHLVVLPIIGGHWLGKKTLVRHACNDERVRSNFPSLIHVNGDSIGRMDREMFPREKTLVVVEFLSDVDDEDWEKFYSLVTHMHGGSKIIIISRIEKLARFGTLKPIRLKNLSHEEYSYLFKVLAFGSANPEDHPRLASIARELPTSMGGSLLALNIFADVLRKNLNVQFWISMLKRLHNVVENHLSVFGEHPQLLLDKDHSIDIASFVLSSCNAPLCLMPPRSKREDDCKSELPKAMFGDLLAGSMARPKDEFEIVMWESRVAPYTKYLATCREEKPQHTASSRRKRRL